MLTQAELKELLVYDPVTGIFTNRVTRNSRALIGAEAGKDRLDGYRDIKINHKIYLTHRLAWLYVHGEWPADQIDHINGVRSDNRIDNLRVVTNKQNGENQTLRSNNTSGHRGVTWDKVNGKWMAQIKHHGKIHHLGYFSILEEAAAAAKAMRDRLFTHHKTEYSA